MSELNLMDAQNIGRLAFEQNMNIDTNPYNEATAGAYYWLRGWMTASLKYLERKAELDDYINLRELFRDELEEEIANHKKALEYAGITGVPE